MSFWVGLLRISTANLTFDVFVDTSAIEALSPCQGLSAMLARAAVRGYREAVVASLQYVLSGLPMHPLSSRAFSVSRAA